MTTKEVTAVALVMEHKCPNGGTVRIFDDCLPDTPEENERRRRETQRIAMRILTNAVENFGVDEVRRRITEDKYAQFFAPLGAKA
ncbi:MAG: hypothetical protein J6K72_08600 [Clostridia bacterium]|nr:hypothetical protein [Clostridia bacterium]